MNIDSPIEVIAEVGVNHNGQLSLASDLVHAAAEAGANTVKFQLFNPALLASAGAGLVDYQIRNGIQAANQRQMLDSLTLSPDQIGQLKSLATSLGLDFLVTPFDLQSLDFLVSELAETRIKIGSGDVTNLNLLFSASKSGVQVILSTGMSTLEEVKLACAVLAAGAAVAGEILPRDFVPTRKNLLTHDHEVKVFKRQSGSEFLKLMHCTSTYPAPESELNISALQAMKPLGFGLGYSDHSKASLGSVMALAFGARVFEKHLTLTKEMEGPDHAASLDPGEFGDYRKALNSALLSLGDGLKVPMPSELDTRELARRGIFAACAIESGEAFTASNIVALRPSTATGAEEFFEVLTMESPRRFKAGEEIAF